MPIAYIRPGVSVDEIINPTFQPLLGEETSICIVGPAQGAESKTEIVQLIDEVPIALSVSDGIDLSSVVVTSLDGLTIYTQGTGNGNTGAAAGRPNGDFYISGNFIQRSMQTAITSDQEVVVYYEVDSGSGVAPHQELVTLHESDPTFLTIQGAAPSTLIQKLAVQGEGIIPSGSYSISYGVGSAQSTIAVINGQIFTSNSQQTVYLDFNDAQGIRHYSVPVQLNGTTPVNIPGTGSVGGPEPTGSANLLVKNVSDPTITDQAVLFASTSDSSALLAPGSGADFTLLGDSATPRTYNIFRPAGVVTTSAIPSGASVSVGYRATPADYYLPTRVFSQNDVEDKYGPAVDSTGATVSPVSLATAIAFGNGATTLVVQALFSQTTVNGQVIRTPGGTATGSGSDALNLQDWKNTFVALRDIEDVNVIVPIVSASGTPSDSLCISVFQALQTHIAFMVTTQDQYLVAICGEDSTTGNSLASQATLQGHALTLQSSPYGEDMVLLSPAGFQFANPVTGTLTDLGGQYVAAGCAGRLASQSVAKTLTRVELLGGILAVKDFRTEAQKDADAASGLMEIEAKNGVIRVRHAVTTAVNSANTRELSVVRAKHYMIESVKTTLDDQAIGQIIADSRAAFTVQLMVIDVLEQLVSSGIIVTYQDVQAQLLTTDPTAIMVRFSYSPSFPLNYINVQFSINTSNGVVTSDTSQGL